MFIYITILYNTEYINSYIYHGIQIKSVCKSLEENEWIILISQVFCESIIIEYISANNDLLKKRCEDIYIDCKKSISEKKGNLYIVDGNNGLYISPNRLYNPEFQLGGIINILNYDENTLIFNTSNG